MELEKPSYWKKVRDEEDGEKRDVRGLWYVDGLCCNCRENLRVRRGSIEDALRFVVTLKKLQAEIDMIMERRGQVRNQALCFLRDDKVANRSTMDPCVRIRPTVESGSNVATGEGR